MSIPRMRRFHAEVEKRVQEYLELHTKRLEAESEIREIKRKLDDLKKSIQASVGVADQPDIPFVTQIGDYYITQIKKHREVRAYAYDFIEFNVSQDQS